MERNLLSIDYTSGEGGTGLVDAIWKRDICKVKPSTWNSDPTACQILIQTWLQILQSQSHLILADSFVKSDSKPVVQVSEHVNSQFRTADQGGRQSWHHNTIRPSCCAQKY